MELREDGESWRELHESADQLDCVMWVGDNVRQSKSGPGLILSELVSRVRSKLAF